MAKFEYDPEGMDMAAGAAEKELQTLSEEVVRTMAQWWAKWYMRAGHKRLGRILATYSKWGQK